MLEIHTRLAILASPGGGKSTLLKRLAIAYGDPERRHLINDHLPDRKWLPIYLRCRELRERARAPFLELIDTVADRALISDGKSAFRTYVLHALRDGSALLLVDGLDEIANVSDRASFVHSLRTFLAVYPNVHVVITSRKAGFRFVAGLLASVCLQADISDFNNGDIEQLTVSWHCQVLGDRSDVVADARTLAQTIIRNDRIRRLATNPLLLTTLLLVKRWVGQLPTKRSVLYGKAVEVLLMTWNVEGHEPIEQDEALPQLCYIAYAMMESGTQKISRGELSRLLLAAREDLAAELGFARIKVADFIERIESRSSLIMLSGHDIVDGTLTEFYEFRHLTFQEYLTAKAIIEGWYPARKDSDTLVSLLERFFADEKWREVVPLAAVLAGRRAEPIIQKLIEDCGKSVAVTQRLAKCLADEVQVTRSTVQSALSALLGKGAGWTTERRLIGTGKYGPLLREEAGSKYVGDVTPARDHLFRIIGEIVLIDVEQTGKPIWEELQALLSSSNTLSRCEGALASRLVTEYPAGRFNQIVNTLISQLRSETIPERIAACAALHQIGHKKFRKSQPDPSVIFARASLLEPLLEQWLTGDDALLHAMAARVICVMPLTPKVTVDGMGGDTCQAFFERALQGWSNFSLDEKVASLVTAFHIGRPWDSQQLLIRCIGFFKNFHGYRSKKLANLIQALGGEIPNLGAKPSRRRPLALIHTAKEAPDLLDDAVRD